MDEKELQPITSLKDMSKYAGRIVRFSKDGGKTFEYGKVDENQSAFESGRGYVIHREVSPTGVHSMTSASQKDFESEKLFVVEANPDEIKDRDFSYS